MKKRSADLKMVRREIESCLYGLAFLNVFFPYQAIRNPTWEELQDFATEAYAVALEDVLSAMDGDFKRLREASSPDGRLLVRSSDRDLLIEHFSEDRERLKEELRKYEEAE